MGVPSRVHNLKTLLHIDDEYFSGTFSITGRYFQPDRLTGTRHTTVTSNVTAIPSDTSMNRCTATTQGGRPWATSNTMLRAKKKIRCGGEVSSCLQFFGRPALVR